MAKALLGHIGSDPRVVAKTMSENRLLRQRVGDLEALVSRLQDENDALVHASSTELLTFGESMQPA
jgi:hypothetical protein